jgi:hypothetical protein
MDAKLLHKLKFHLARLAQEETEDDWQKVVELCERLLDEAPDARTLALSKRLAAAAPALRDWTLPAEFAVLQRELEAATRKASSTAAAPATPEEQVAALLKGRVMVVIGGDRRPDHQERLRETFGLREVLWPDTREQKPDVAALESCVARTDVAVVVLMIRWIRHALGEVATLCERHDKPLVRLTAGYNPAQVAVAILEQTGKRLSG